VRTVAFGHEVASPNELWDGMLGGTVRTPALLLAQTGDVQAHVRAGFDRRVEDYRRGDHVYLAISVKLAAGRKPTADGLTRTLTSVVPLLSSAMIPNRDQFKRRARGGLRLNRVLASGRE